MQILDSALSSLNVMRVDHWKRDEDFAVHPIGSKPKQVLILTGPH
jgi:hypothetical protein